MLLHVSLFLEIRLSVTEIYLIIGIPSLLVVDHFRVELVETIPSVLIFDNTSFTYSSTYEAWKQLLDDARVSIDIAAFYWNLRDPAAHLSSWKVSLIS